MNQGFKRYMDKGKNFAQGGGGGNKLFSSGILLAGLGLALLANSIYYGIYRK